MPARPRIRLAASLAATLCFGLASASADELDIRDRVVDARPPIAESDLERARLVDDALITDRVAEANAIEMIELAKELADLADSLTFLYGGNDPFVDLLGGLGESLFPDASTAPDLGGERQDGLPDDAPPSGWGFGGLAFQDGVIRGPVGTPVGRPLRPTRASQDISSLTVWIGSSFVRMESWTEHGDVHSVWELTTSEGLVWIKYNKNGRTVAIIEGPAWESRPGDPVVDRKPGAGDKPTDGGKPDAGDKPKKPSGKATNPGDDLTEAQRAWAEWLWRQHQLGRHNPDSGPIIPNRVNPGDPEYDGRAPIGPSIWDVLAEDALVVNPDPTDTTGADRIPSERAWNIMQDVLLGNARGVTPGGRPPQDD